MGGHGNDRRLQPLQDSPAGSGVTAGCGRPPASPPLDRGDRPTTRNTPWSVRCGRSSASATTITRSSSSTTAPPTVREKSPKAWAPGTSGSRCCTSANFRRDGSASPTRRGAGRMRPAAKCCSSPTPTWSSLPMPQRAACATSSGNDSITSQRHPDSRSPAPCCGPARLRPTSSSAPGCACGRWGTPGAASSSVSAPTRSCAPAPTAPWGDTNGWRYVPDEDFRLGQTVKMAGMRSALPRGEGPPAILSRYHSLGDLIRRHAKNVFGAPGLPRLHGGCGHGRAHMGCSRAAGRSRSCSWRPNRSRPVRSSNSLPARATGFWPQPSHGTDPTPGGARFSCSGGRPRHGVRDLTFQDPDHAPRRRLGRAARADGGAQESQGAGRQVDRSASLPGRTVLLCPFIARGPAFSPAARPCPRAAGSVAAAALPPVAGEPRRDPDIDRGSRSSRLRAPVPLTPPPPSPHPPPPRPSFPGRPGISAALPASDEKSPGRACAGRAPDRAPADQSRVSATPGCLNSSSSRTF